MEKKTKFVLILIVLVLIATALIAIIKFGYSEEIKKDEISVELKNMSMKADYSWNKVELEDDYAKLKHKSYDAAIEISKEKIPNEYTEYDIEEIANIVISNIEEQYESYNLLARENEKIDDKEFYKLLLSNEEYQTLIVIYKENVNLFISSYSASTEVFDILLDSALVILYNIEYLDDTYEIPQYKIAETTGINWIHEETSDYVTKKEKEIYYDTYHTIISVPEVFVDYEFSSKEFHYVYSNCSIIGNIQAKNIHEYILSDINETTLKQEYESLQKNYDNVIVESEYQQDRYVYIFKYANKNSTYEDAYIVYPLDNTHILRISISARNKKISKELVDSITLKSFDRYAKNIVYKSEKIGKNTFDFMTYDKSYVSETYYKVKLHLPEVYDEIDNNANSQVNRYFAYKYDFEKNKYLYEIQTQVYSNKYNKTNEEYIEDQCPISAKNITIDRKETITVNNNKFENYSLKYELQTANGISTVEERFLIIDISENVYMVTRFTSNDIEIPDEIIIDFTDITYQKETY